MARRNRPARRVIPPDPRYGNVQVAVLINKVMTRGKKSTAERVVYGAFDRIQSQAGRDPLDTFLAAMRATTPVLEVKPRRVGGATYQVPVEVRPDRRTALAMQWLIQYSRSRGEKTMADRLANELISASKGEGLTIKKKEDTHRMAEANKAFAHYRW